MLVIVPIIPSIGTLRYEDGELGRRRGWTSKTRSRPVVLTKNKILKSKEFLLGTATAIFLSRTRMSTFKDARTFLVESYLDDVINDDEFSYSTIRWNLLHPRTRNFHMNYCYYYYYYTIIIILTCYNNITIQKYRNNTLNSSSATSRLLMSFSIPLAIQLASQYVLSREGCSDLELPFCQL